MIQGSNPLGSVVVVNKPATPGSKLGGDIWGWDFIEVEYITVELFQKLIANEMGKGISVFAITVKLI